MIQEAASAPSSSNMQPWRFIVIQDTDVKKELKEIANNQGQVETASAVIAVIGDAEMYHKADQILSQNVAQGFIAEEKKASEIAPAGRSPSMTTIAMDEVLPGLRVNWL